MNKNKLIDELVDLDGSPIEGDRNPVNNKEIETGPTPRTFNDNSNYEKGVSTTMDKTVRNYRQKLPFYPIYSYSPRSVRMEESIKEIVDEVVEDLVKKGYDHELIDSADNTIKKLLKSIEEKDLNDEQLKHLEKLIKNKRENKKIKL